MFVIAAAVAATVAAPVLAADPGVLSGDALRDAVSGKTVMLETPLGTLPINYRSDGSMSSQTKQLASYTGSERDTGSWWVSRDKLCQRWDKWLEGKSYCFTLRRDGRTVHWTRNDGLSGVATIAR